MKTLLRIALITAAVSASWCAQAVGALEGARSDALAASAEVRLKDLGKLQGWRENPLVGYGIVTGLAGTGDSASNRATRQTLSNVLSQFNMTLTPDQVQSRNVAVVLVSAALSAFAREGDTLDVTVSSAGDARSLVGGTLLVTPLKGPNSRVYALAQGPLSVGGYKYDSNGNVLQKNHPTVGSIPGGATVEVGVGAQMMNADERIVFLLSAPDFTTANRIAEAINQQMGTGLAQARDSSAVEIAVPKTQQGQLVSFLSRIENTFVSPDRRAKVVVNERTGTVVAGGDVRLSPVAISQGDLKVSIVNENAAIASLSRQRGALTLSSAALGNTRLDVDERSGFVEGQSTVADLVRALVLMNTSTRDIISILRAIKAAGALHAELIIQ